MLGTSKLKFDRRARAPDRRLGQRDRRRDLERNLHDRERPRPRLQDPEVARPAGNLLEIEARGVEVGHRIEPFREHRGRTRHAAHATDRPAPASAPTSGTHAPAPIGESSPCLRPQLQELTCD